jgi:hypothetical protein
LRTADRPYSIERQVVVSKQKKAGNGPIKKVLLVNTVACIHKL